MGRIAFIFPGQGSQRVGMGRQFAEESATARNLFDQADRLLGFELSKLCFEGPDAELTRTENTQPAIFTVSVIAARLLEERGMRPERAAGHSLGEYSALAAAGVMSFEDGLTTVRRRGVLMASVGERVSGSMAAILGLPVDAVTEVCAEAAAAGAVEVANYNTPEQTVISGETPAVERAMALATARGARRALKLNVSAPFHSSLMAPLAEEMAGTLARIEMRAPAFPIVANVTADYVRTPEAIREALVRQMAGSVRWTETILRLASDGIDTTVEVGPGRVLTGMTPRIVPCIEALDTAEALSQCRT